MRSKRRRDRPTRVGLGLALVAVLSLVGALAPATPAVVATAPAPGTEVAVDVVYLIDISGSIIGLGQSQGDLLPTLIQALVDEVYRTKAGTSLSVATFGDGLHDVDGQGAAYEEYRTFTVDPADLPGSRQRIVEYVRGLDRAVRQPGGYASRTALYDSAREIIERLDRSKTDWEDRHPGQVFSDSRIQKVVIFTDGLDNASKVWSREDFEREVAARAEHLFVKVVTAPGVAFPTIRGVPVETGFANRSVEVIPLPRSVHLGNVRALAQGEHAVAYMRLVAQRPIPTSRIDFAYSFPGIPEGALGLTLNPDVIDGDPTQVLVEVRVEVRDKEALDRAAVAAGRTAFTGRLILAAANPRVSLLPSETPLSFSYEPTGSVEVSPATGSGAGVFPKLHRPLREDSRAEVTYLLRFDEEARATGLCLVADFVWDERDTLGALAARTGARLVGFRWEPGGPPGAPPGGIPGPVVLGPGTERLTVVLTLPRELEPELPAGPHGGRLVLTASGGAELRFAGKDAGKVTGVGTGRLEVPLEARVPRPPLPAWAWLVAAAVVAALAVLVYLLTVPRFEPGQEVTVTHADGRRRSYELADEARHDRWKGSYVTLGSRDDAIDLRQEDRIGVLWAGRRRTVVFEPDPDLAASLKAEHGHDYFTVSGEPATGSRRFVLVSGDSVRLGRTHFTYHAGPEGEE